MPSIYTVSHTIIHGDPSSAHNYLHHASLPIGLLALYISEGVLHNTML